MKVFQDGARLFLAVALTTTLFATGLTTTTAAQDAGADEGEGGTQEKTIEEQIQELSDDLVTREKDLRELRAKIDKEEGTVTGEMLESELVERRERFRRGMAELVELIHQGEDSGTNAAQARTFVTQLLKQDADTIRAEKLELDEKLKALGETIDKGTPDEAADAREDRDGAMPVSDRLLKQMDSNIQLRQELGLTVKSDVKLISKTLGANAVGPDRRRASKHQG